MTIEDAIKERKLAEREIQAIVTRLAETTGAWVEVLRLRDYAVRNAVGDVESRQYFVEIVARV